MYTSSILLLLLSFSFYPFLQAEISEMKSKLQNFKGTYGGEPEDNQKESENELDHVCEKPTFRFSILDKKLILTLPCRSVCYSCLKKTRL